MTKAIARRHCSNDGRRVQRVLGILAAPFFFLLSGCAGPSKENEGGGIHLVVEQRLAQPLDSSLSRYADDLRKEGYTVTIDDTLAGTATPAEIRSALQRRWREEPKLRGAIFVGEFGAPLYNLPERQGDPYWHDHLVDLYYMDLDGAWLDRDDNGVLDRHQSYEGRRFGRLLSAVAHRIPLGLDRRAPEIWVSRLRAGTLSALGDELALYHDYFARNHEYRNGGIDEAPIRAFVVAPQAKFSESGWGVRPSQLYDDVAISECISNPSEMARQYLSDRQGWAIGTVGSFSGPTMHKFDYIQGEGFDENLFKSLEGRQQIADYSVKEIDPWDFSAHDVAALKPNVFFYHVLSSETGRHDHENYLGGAYLFFGSGLAVIAGTQHSGAVGVPMLYDELAEEESIGDAWFNAIQWSMEQRGSSKLKFRWCDRDDPYDPSGDVYKAVLLGDGTLRVPRREGNSEPG